MWHSFASKFDNVIEEHRSAVVEILPNPYITLRAFTVYEHALRLFSLWQSCSKNAIGPQVQRYYSKNVPRDKYDFWHYVGLVSKLRQNVCTWKLVEEV